MHKRPIEFVPGKALGQCQRCARTRFTDEMGLEWTNLRVCLDTCWDPRPPYLDPPVVVPEGLPVWNSAPLAPDVFIDPVNDPVTPADL